MDPDVLAELEAIDATLRGEAVDPDHAELAELALLVSADRPAPRAAFAAELDARVARRFAAGPVPAPGSAAPGRSARLRWARRPSSRGVFGGLAGALAAAAIVAVVVIGNGGGSSSQDLIFTPGSPAPGQHAAVNGTASGTYTSSAASGAASSPPRAAVPAPERAPSAKVPSSAGSPSNQSAAAGTPPVTDTLGPLDVSPVAHGRKQIQSAQLQLSAPENRIETVAQELFAAVGQVGGIVRSSSITDATGGNGYATFQLSIPSAALGQTMTQLSELRYARVAARTDQTQDVNGQYQADVRRLADARALRTSLLKQLAAATTTTQVASLTAQIHDAEASISSDESTLRGLNHQVSFSELSVQVNAGPVVQPALGTAGSSDRRFGIGQALHDAGRVLTVAAGVALIVLAALVPFALLAALWAWVAYVLRRRRREQAHDAA